MWLLSVPFLQGREEINREEINREEMKAEHEE
jgi:hypothetical protein